MTALIIVQDWDKLSDGEKNFFAGNKNCAFLALNETGLGDRPDRSGHTTVLVNKNGHEGFGRKQGLVSTLVEWFAGIYQSKKDMDRYEQDATSPI